MKDIIVEKIESEIERLLEELTKVDPISDDYKVITTRIGNLYETLNKENELTLCKDKLEVEKIFKNDESLLKQEELKQTKLWNGVKTGVEIVGVVVPLVFYGVWMNRGLKFEEEGSFTSTTFKGLISKFKPTK